MLGLYTNFNNNTYLNQNYSNQNYSYNPYQQTSILGGYSTGYANNYTNSYSNGYSNFYQQQSPMNTNSMILSMISSLLPLILGMFSNAQTATQPATATTLPVTTNNSTVLNGNSAQNNIFNTIINIILNSAKTPVSVDEDTVNVKTTCGGDPHFYIGDGLGKGSNKLAYDFQGENNKVYSLLDNSDISVNARFLDGTSAEAAQLGVSSADVARVIGDMDVAIKDTGINVVSHNNGNFEIYEDGEKIADQSNYKDVEDKLKAKDISIGAGTTNYGVITIKHGDRVLEVSKSHGGMWLDSNRMVGDTGLTEQAYGALDSDHDGKTVGVADVNKDGTVDDNDTIKYSLNNQLMVNGTGTAAEITPEIEEAIKKDLIAGIKQGSAVKGYSTDHGYSAMQWNEYVGGKAFTTTDKLLIS